MKIDRKYPFALIPVVMLAMVACNLSDQAHTPEKLASPTASSEVTAAIDTSLEGIDIDSATLDSLIRESGTSDSAIESQSLEEETAPIAAKTSAASKPCLYSAFRWAGGTCTNPYPVKKKKGPYISRRIGKEFRMETKVQSLCADGVINDFRVEVTGSRKVSRIGHTCGPRTAPNRYKILPARSPNPLEGLGGGGQTSIRSWEGLLVGIHARSGDYIDALGPITLKAHKLSLAQPFGNLNGGTRKPMLCPMNYYVAGFIGYKGPFAGSSLEGLRMVCEEFNAPPGRRRLIEGAYPPKPFPIAKNMALGFIAAAANHVVERHVKRGDWKDYPSIFSSQELGDSPNDTKMALFLQDIFAKGIFYNFWRVGDQYHVTVRSNRIIGEILSKKLVTIAITSVTKFIFNARTPNAPILVTAFPIMQDEDNMGGLVPYGEL